MVQTVKNPAANAGDPGLVSGLGRSPGGGHGNPLQHACLENPHGQRSLAGYSPWGHKESGQLSDCYSHAQVGAGDGTFLTFFF